MGSKLLRAGDTDRGLSGIINRQFEKVRSLYTRLLTGTLNYRPVVLTLWAIVAVLMIPFYMFSQRELAPAEDQGVVFGVIQSSANSTLDQTNLFTDQVYQVYKSFPESGSGTVHRSRWSQPTRAHWRRTLWRLLHRCGLPET